MGPLIQPAILAIILVLPALSVLNESYSWWILLLLVFGCPGIGLMGLVHSSKMKLGKSSTFCMLLALWLQGSAFESFRGNDEKQEILYGNF
jgi:hypothetical protein